MRKVLCGADTEGFREIPARVRKVVAVSERVVSTLEHIARRGLRNRPSAGRLPAAEIVEQVARVNASVGALARASALTLSLRYGEFVAELEALLALAEQVRERGVDGNE